MLHHQKVYGPHPGQDIVGEVAKDQDREPRPARRKSSRVANVPTDKSSARRKDVEETAAEVHKLKELIISRKRLDDAGKTKAKVASESPKKRVAVAATDPLALTKPRIIPKARQLRLAAANEALLLSPPQPQSQRKPSAAKRRVEIPSVDTHVAHNQQRRIMQPEDVMKRIGQRRASKVLNITANVSMLCNNSGKKGEAGNSLRIRVKDPGQSPAKATQQPFFIRLGHKAAKYTNRPSLNVTVVAPRSAPRTAAHRDSKHVLLPQESPIAARLPAINGEEPEAGFSKHFRIVCAAGNA